MKTWVIYTLMFGYPMPTNDQVRFSTESGCQVYLASTYKPRIREAFKIYCNDTGPLTCQDKPCGEK